MVTIISRIIRCNFNRNLQVFECRCLKTKTFIIRASTISAYHSVQKRENSLCDFNSKLLFQSGRYISDEKKKEIEQCEKTKPSLFQRFKQMYKEYWYVLIPVHIITSIGWFGGFYYMARSGVDITGVLEALHFNEKIINSMKDSNMGYVAIAYGCYKIATPARYTVTLGGTTVTINYLKKWGYIKPVPSSEKLKEMYKEKKTSFDKSMRDKKVELKTKIDNRLEQGLHKIEEFKDKTDKMKKRAEDILKEKK